MHNIKNENFRKVYLNTGSTKTITKKKKNRFVEQK